MFIVLGESVSLSVRGECVAKKLKIDCITT